MSIKEDFVPFTEWKPFHTITFVDYEFTVKGNDIQFDERVMPEQLDVKEGDKFTVKLNEFGGVTFVKE